MKIPAIFNLEEPLAKGATMFMFYWLTPLLLILFSVRADSMSEGVFSLISSRYTFGRPWNSSVMSNDFLCTISAPEIMKMPLFKFQ